MMDYRENAGYLITDSCHVGDSEFVLGVHLTEPHQFVTWKCTNQTDYYWGHYFSDLFSAQKDFVARAQEEVQYLEEQRQNPVRLKAPGYSPWGEVQTCETLAPVRTRSAQQGMAVSWFTVTWQTRFSAKKQRNVDLRKASISALRRTATGRWPCGS